MEEIIVGVTEVMLACFGAIVIAAYIVGVPMFISDKLTNKYKDVEYYAALMIIVVIWNAISLFASLLVISSYNLWHYFSF